LPVVVEAVAAARSAAGLNAPLIDLHPDRPDQRGLQLPSGTFALLPAEPTFDQIEAAGGRIELSDETHVVAGYLNRPGFDGGSGYWIPTFALGFASKA
jgi:7,8-dihydropterin-6-yl-methyl-4-(beta-D-ribofuranosyl)aminobenzene 5'-phosphate synthase